MSRLVDFALDHPGKAALGLIAVWTSLCALAFLVSPIGGLVFTVVSSISVIRFAVELAFEWGRQR